MFSVALNFSLQKLEEMSHNVQKEEFKVIREGGSKIIANRRNFIRRAQLKTRSPEVCRGKERVCARDGLQTRRHFSYTF